MTRIDFFSSEQAYSDHLAPIWDALPPEVRGTWYLSSRRPNSCPTRTGPLATADAPPETAAPICVASYSDLCRTVGRPVAFVEHGCGFSYDDGNPGYSGGRDRDAVGLFIVPSETVGRRNAEAYPHAEVAVVGCPRLDDAHRAMPFPSNDPPVIALAWHWQAPGRLEQSGCFAEWAPHLGLLTAEFEVLGHAHPRMLGFTTTAYDRWGIEVVPDFADVLPRADLLIADSTSVIYEFASTGRPVVLLDGEGWDPAAGIWPRFVMPTSAVGLHCGHPSALVETVRLALVDAPVVRAARETAVAEVYSACDGRASERAAAALMAWVPDRERVRLRPAGRG